MSLSGQAAIAGIGATEFSKESGRSELQLSAEATLHALADAGLTPADVDGLVTFTMDNSSEIALARELGMGDLRFFSRINYGGGAACATVQQAAMAVATGVADVVVCYRGFNERSGQRFGQVLELGRDAGQHQRARQRLDLPARPLHAGGDGGDAGPALHARVRRHVRGLRHRRGRRPEACGDQPGRLLPRQADHDRGPPGVADDRRPAAAARLLPGERRRRGARGDLTRTGRVAEAAGRLDHRGGAGECGGPVRDDVVLPRRHRRPGDGRRRARAVAPVRAVARRHRDGGALRPLHAVRADAARGARLLRPRRGPRLHRRRRHRDRRPAARSTPTAASSARPTSTA